MFIVFLGPPGCGKGTQAAIFEKEMSYKIVSTGDILRKNNGRVVDPKTGETINDIISRGKLLPDFVTIDIVSEEVSRLKDESDCKNIIFDGFPRTSWQTGALEVIAKPSIVFSFVTDEENLVKRITGRFQCVKCGRIYNKLLATTKTEGICDSCGGSEFETRSDDNEEILRTRLSEYHKKTFPIIEFYSMNGRLINVDADAPVEKVTEEIVSVLKKEMR
ncbi:MAG: nucleoside monophosphate kinase [Holosporales bacterium]|jgi:adenylate kinase|nr:nucleoside monophosphate kinase [Holosporales bacterium]